MHWRSLMNQPQVDLVDQSRGLQGVPRSFPAQVMRSKLPKVLVHARNQLRSGLGIAIGQAFQQNCNVVLPAHRET